MAKKFTEPENDKPLKNAIRSIPDGMPSDKMSFNAPAIILDYEKHEEGIKDRKSLEMDEPCKYKQGFLGIITDTLIHKSLGRINLKQTIYQQG